MKKMKLIFITFIMLFGFMSSVCAKNEIQTTQTIQDDKVIIVLKGNFEKPALAIKFKLECQENIKENITVTPLSNYNLTKGTYYLFDTLDEKESVDIAQIEIPYSIITEDDLTFNLKEISYSDGDKTYSLNDYDIVIKGLEKKEELENEIVEIEKNEPTDEENKTSTETNEVNNPKTGEIIPLLFIVVLIVMSTYVVHKIKKSKKFYKI